MVTARNIGLRAEPRFQRHCWEPVTGFRCDGPSLNVRRAKGAELPKAFVVEIPSGFFSGNRAREYRAEGVAYFMRRAPLEGRRFAIQAQIVKVQRVFVP